MKVKVQVKVKVAQKAQAKATGGAIFTLALASTLTFALLTACGRSEEPSASDAATPVVRPAPVISKDIETAVVNPSQLEPVFTLVGKVAYGEDRYSRISSPLQGRVLDVRVKLGDRVKAGDVLLLMDSPDITSAYSDFIKEASELDYATRAFELHKDLYESKAVPFKDFKQAENDLVKARAEFRRSKERLLSLRVPVSELEKPLAQQRITARFEMRSPLTGTVVERTVTPGQSVGGDPSQVLFTVADLDKLQVVADVYERDIALVKVGQVATVNVEAYPGVGFPAAIALVGDVVDPNTRTVKVRAWVNNDSHKLKPEMFARLNIQIGEATRFLAVPKEAVLEMDGKQFVYVVAAEGRYVKRQVKVAPSAGDQLLVLEGLKPGERIVTKGAVLIKGQEAQG